MLPARPSSAISLQQFLSNLGKSPTGSSQDDVGLPLSRISSPNRPTNAQRLTSHNDYQIPTLSNAARQPNMRFAPRSSQHFLARTQTLPLPTTASCATATPIDLAITATQALIRRYSIHLKDIHHLQGGLNATDLATIEENFNAEKSAIFIDHHVPASKINRWNNIIGDHYRELIFCLAGGQKKLAEMVIISLNKNFIQFAKD